MSAGVTATTALAAIGTVASVASAVGGLGKKQGGSRQAAPTPIAPTGRDPTIAAAEEEERRKRAGAGRASTVLTGPQGLGESGTPGAPRASKTVLGV